jgi:hypothetical protein
MRLVFGSLLRLRSIEWMDVFILVVRNGIFLSVSEQSLQYRKLRGRVFESLNEKERKKEDRAYV